MAGVALLRRPVRHAEGHEPDEAITGAHPNEREPRGDGDAFDRQGKSQRSEDTGHNGWDMRGHGCRTVSF
ncbi:hypothetical protein GCM10007148_13150 [Parvularcula lutaonensis]|nr:hypothetical protein GCM10007148_13150 [Parvularcula lutaonensis]